MLILSAETGAARAADLFFGEMPIVLTASRLAQSPLDAPAAITTIDREMIEASGFTELHDLLRLVPGFLVADWPDGSPTVASHGLGDAYGRRIKVMIDGRTVNSPLWGDTNWHDLPLRVDDIDHIEVVRGPHGAAYGANAFQGVVNIITRSPATEEGVTLISRMGDYGFMDNGFRLNGASGGAIDWRVSGSRRSAVTFRSHRDDEGEPQSEEAIRRSVVNFQASSQLSSRDELRLQLGASDGADRRGYPPETANYAPIRTDRNRHHYLQLAWTRSFDTESDLTLQYYHQAYRVRSDWLSVEDSYPVSIDLDTRRDDLELQFTRRLSPHWHLLLGAGARHDAVRSAPYFDRSDTLQATYWQTFGSVTWQPVEALRINLGGTFEHHDYSGKLFSPRLAINYALDADSALRFSAGRSYRAPSLMESDAQQTVRADGQVVRMYFHAGLPVDPERVTHAELGYVAQIRPLGLSIDTRVFRERYTDYIDDQFCRHNRAPLCPFAPPEGYNRSTSYFVNSGSFTMHGVEFSVDWRKPGFGRAVLSQAFIEIEAEDDILDDNLVKSAPSATTSLLLIKDLPQRWRFSLGYYHNEPMRWLNDGGAVSSRDRFDIKLAKAFGPVGAESEFALTMQSVGGSYGEFDENQFAARPQVFASLRLAW